jgi:diamine N-acetyltransferase
MSDVTHLDIVPVDGANWREVADLEVEPEQRAFVMDPARYLALCCYGTAGWSPLAIRQGGRVVGFLMWAVDPDDGACWLGGILIDRAWQRRGIGRRAVRAALTLLAERHGHRRFALSYRPENVVARRTYAALGFDETGEREDDEVVARLELDGADPATRPSA